MYMANFKEYIATDGQCGAVDASELDDLLERYEWFSVARTVRAHLFGTTDKYLSVTAASRGVSSLDLQPINVERLLAPDAAPDCVPAPVSETEGESAYVPEPKSDPASAPDAASCGADGTRSAADGQNDVIERFLHLDDYRIVADENAPDEEIRTEAQLSDEDDVVSEELAEVYLSQGLRDEACAIYRKLSLLNPKKSVYFAEIIEKIENNN